MHIDIPMIFGDFQKQGVFQQNPNYGLTPLLDTFAFFWPGRREMWGQWPEDGGLKSEVGEGGGRRSCLIGGTAI